MRTLREVLSPRALVSKERRSVVGSLGSRMINVYKDTVFTPHETQMELEKAYETEPIFRSAIDMVTDFVHGGDIVFKSDDKMTQIRGETFIKELGMNEWLPEAIRQTVKTGNGYVEVDYNPITGLPQKFYPIALSSRIYVNCNEFGESLLVNKAVFDEGTQSYATKEVPDDDSYYIQRLDPNTPNKAATWYDMTYSYGSKFLNFRIYGIPIHKEKIIHFKMNMGYTGVYGTTHFASAIDDKQILKDMERSIAIISRYKAIPRKFIQYGDKDNPATGEELDDFIVYMESLEKDEDPVVNKPIKVDDLSYAGGDINLSYMLEHIRKKLISGVVPDFLTGFGQDVNRSTAQVQLIAFVLSIYAKRKCFLTTIQEKVIKPWLEKESELQEGHIEFNELDFEDKGDKSARILQLWSGNMITLNRALDMLGENKIGDEGDTYYTKWQNEMMASSQTEQEEQGGQDYVPTLLPGGRPITQTPLEDDATTMPPDYSLRPESFKEEVGSLKDDPAGLDPLINQCSYKIRSTYQEKLNKVKKAGIAKRVEKIKQLNSLKEELGYKEDLRQKDIRELATFLRIEEGDVRPHVDYAIENAFAKGNLDSAKRMGLQSVIPVGTRFMNKLKKDAYLWVEKNHNEGANKIEEVLTAGIMGDVIGKKLEEKIDKAYKFIGWKSEQLARTELRKAYSEGVKYVMQNSPHKSWKWVASGRENMCKVCQGLNGKVFRVEDIRQSMPPIHPNCACGAETVVDR